MQHIASKGPAAVTAEYLFMTLVNLSAQNFRKKQETQ